MKKYFISLFVLFTFVLPSFAQVRNYVGIVRRQFSDVHMQFIEDSKPVLSKKQQQAKDKADKIQQDLKKENNIKETEYQENVDKDSFGSGFVVVMDDGTNYVITNNHVIRDCTSAMIEFIVNGESTIYYNLKVLATSSEMDIAILTFPEGTKPFKNALKFSDKVVADGDEVWSAGYPGLRNKPEWQLAKGNVTSSQAVIEELLKSKYSTIIQHSAPIDAGNSGGPLLEADNSSIGFSVIGINTWKAYNRELTGFTIPAKLIKQYIEDARKRANLENGTELVTERAQKFFELFSKSYKGNTDLEEYIAIPYFDNLSYNYVNNVKNTANYYYVGWRFSADKLDGKKAALSYQMWQKYNLVESQKSSSPNVTDEEKKYNFVSIDVVEDKPELTFKVVYEDEKKENQIETYWAEDLQQWKIIKISYTKNSKKYSLETKDEKLNKGGKKASSDDEGIIHGMSGTIIKYAFQLPMNIFDVELSNGPDQTQYKGISISGENYANFGWIGVGYLLDWQVTEDHYFKLLGISLCVQCPFDFTYFTVMPSADIGATFAILSNAAHYGWYWEGNVTVLFGEDSNYGLGCGFRTVYMYPIREKDYKYQIPTLNIFFVWRDDY